VKRVAVIHHLDQPFLGNAGPPLREVELEEHFGTLPALANVDGIISFGGIQSVLDGGLEAEAELMRQAVAADVPVLGVCLGAQLLAHALGGKVMRRPRRLVAWTPLVGEWEGYALHWNEDGFEPPPGAVELLRRTSVGGEGFRIGDSAWGVQFHPEVDDAIVESWLADEDDFPHDRERGEFAAEIAEKLPAWNDFGRALCGGFLELAELASAREPLRQSA
jgi:GMP synthase (glutamine-hydrolysing)